MKRTILAVLVAPALMFPSEAARSQAPGISWEGHFPGNYQLGNYTVHAIKESPYGGYVLTGSRKIASPTQGHQQVLVMRVDEEGQGIWMQETFTGYSIDSIFVDGQKVLDTIPWDQEAYDMTFTPLPQLTYLVTGYRDETLVNDETPPGLLLMEITGLGIVNFDGLFFNDQPHHMAGRCIEPDPGGGYIIAGSIRENGSWADKTFVTRMVKEEGIYKPADWPPYTVMEIGNFGYASWIRPYGSGYLLGGSAYRDPGSDDLFLRKVDRDYGEEWTQFYGMAASDMFADALVSTHHIYLAGHAAVPVPGSEFTRDQIYVAKTDTTGEIVWELTCGGTTRHYAHKILMAEDGNLLVAGTAYDASMQPGMVLLKVDAETGDSLWMESYGDFHHAGIRDAIPTSDFGYLLAGRASPSSTQDPRIYVMKLENSEGRAGQFEARKELGLEIVPGATTTDAMTIQSEGEGIFGIWVRIDSLLHPSVGDLEIALEHEGLRLILANRPAHSGEHLLHTTFLDVAETAIQEGFAPYSGRFRPDEPLSPFFEHSPNGDWTLEITDHGGGMHKSTSRVLEGWSLNLLTESGTGTSTGHRVPVEEFGLLSIYPNPVSRQAMIRFRLCTPGEVRLSVYTSLGQLQEVLIEEPLREGMHERTWETGSLTEGTYLIQLETEGMISARKVILR